jgi:type II secretory pathway component PulF
MAFFFRQLAMLVKSGMSSAESLGVLEGQTGNGRLRLATRQAAAHCRTGGKMSDIFQNYPHMFGEPVIEMIKAGEEGGALERFLERVADYLERQYDVSSRIKGALAYPIFMIFALIFIPNVPIWVTAGPAAYFSSTLLWAGSLVGICLSAFIVLRLVLANPSSARLYDQIKLSLPLIGKVVRQFAIGRFGRTLAMLYSAGVNIPHAIEISARACGNSYLAERLATAAGPVRAGGSLVDAIAKTNCMPALALHVMSTGEKTGNMDLMVTKLAEFSEADANTAVDQAVALILPICVIILGGVVLVMVAKFYTGYFANIFKEAGS